MKYRNRLLVVLTALLIASGLSMAWKMEASEGSGKDPQSKRDVLAAWTEGFYQASIEGNRQLAYGYVLKIKSVAGDRELRSLGTKEGWKVLDERLNAAETLIERGEFAYTWREEAARLKLAVDALSRDRNALWRQYERLLREDLSRLRKAWQRGGKEGDASAYAALDQLESHTLRLEAAAAFGAEPARVSLLKERIRYTEKLLQAAPGGPDSANRTLTEGSFMLLGDSVDRLFASDTARSAAVSASGHPSWQWAAMLAVIVLAGLFYTGWQKFRIDRDEITVPKRPYR
ncbi:sporulation protein YpjB [Paenibacillus darwinianus]|uniref:sporulation protein YpjB n=1 Tax=Paenibacillus darwinianus TaxID=1380763 RepID=UPI000B09B3D2|nr:sporulation protein YpjB [Paenibacillus darwinianus]